MSKKILASLAALVAIAACVVVPAMASASPTMTDKAGTLPIVSHITGTQVVPIKFTAGTTTVTCKKSTLNGEVVENSGSSIKVTITSATFTGESGGKCERNNLGEITFTTEIAKTDWCISSTGSDAFSLQAGACGAAASALKFTLDTGIGINCVYTRVAGSPVTGSYVTGETGSTLNIGVGVASEFTSTTFGCPSSGSLDAAFTQETQGTTTHIWFS